MRTLSASILNGRSIWLALVVILAFDSCEEDPMKPEKQDSEIEFYTMPESSIIIDIIGPFAIAAGGVACASFSPWSISLTPSDIVILENGSAWTSMISLPYTMLTQGFSSEGDVGFGAGIDGHDQNKHVMTICKSMDNGKTWIDLAKHIDGYPLQISAPSTKVTYIICRDDLIKYSL